MRLTQLACYAVLLACSTLSNVQAQPINQIAYGDRVTDEITGQEPRSVYRFDGSAGDVIVVEMLSVDRTMHNPLSEPVLQLLNPIGDIMADTTAVFPVDDTVLAAELPIDGDYTIIATRDENVPEPATGQFTLELLQVPQLADNVLATITSDDMGHYYFIRSDEEFTVSYLKLDGDFWPEVSVNRLTPDRGGFDPIGVLYGEGVSFGALGGFPTDETYLIAVRQHPFEFYFNVVTAEYELWISSIQD